MLIRPSVVRIFRTDFFLDEQRQLSFPLQGERCRPSDSGPRFACTRRADGPREVELWLAKIQRDLIARGVFTLVADLGNKLRKYIRAYSKSAKPFR